MRARGAILLLSAAACAGCVGTTGGELLSFEAFAAGPEDAVEGEPYRFTTGRGFEVALTRARLRIGAVYLNRSVPTSVASDTSCMLPGIYVAEVPYGLEVDALSPALQAFPGMGFATSERARTGELWLTGGDLHDEDDPTIILDVAGAAAKDGADYPFEGTITIGRNRVVPPPSPAAPGAKPICKQRVVTPIPLDITPRSGGRLVVRIDPSGLFSNVDFSLLARVEDEGEGGAPRYRFLDSAEDQPSKNLHAGLRASVGVYTIRWEEPR